MGKRGAVTVEERDNFYLQFHPPNVLKFQFPEHPEAKSLPLPVWHAPKYSSCHLQIPRCIHQQEGRWSPILVTLSHSNHLEMENLKIYIHILGCKIVEIYVPLSCFHVNLARLVLFGDVLPWQCLFYNAANTCQGITTRPHPRHLPATHSSKYSLNVPVAPALL